MEQHTITPTNKEETIMAIMRMAELNGEFTKVVAEYLAKGCRFNVTAMGGHQGEEGKVMLTDGTHVYAIYLHDESSTLRDNDYLRWSREMRLTVEKFEDTKRYDRHDTYWLGRGEIVFEKRYQQLSERGYTKVYTDDDDEAIRAEEIRRSRYDYRWRENWKEVPVKHLDKVIDIVKAKTGRKRVFAENIRRVEKHTSSNSWRIIAVFSGKEQQVSVHA